MKIFYLISLMFFCALSVFANDKYIVTVNPTQAKAFNNSFNVDTCTKGDCYIVVDAQSIEQMKQQNSNLVYEKVVMRYPLATGAAYPTQWSLTNTTIGWDAGKTVMDRHTLVGAKKAYIAAVIDTGLSKHADLYGTDNSHGLLYGPSNQHCYNITSPMYDCLDKGTHGTHVAGIIAVKYGAGVADFSGSSYSAGQVLAIGSELDSGGFTSNDLIAALQAVYNKVTVDGDNIVAVNMSLGGTSRSQAEFNEIEKLSQQGVIVVASAGNENSNNTTIPKYPASYELNNIASVAALNSSLRLANYSNYGTDVTIAAPGSSIISTVTDTETTSNVFNSSVDASTGVVLTNWTTSGGVFTVTNPSSNSIVVNNINVGALSSTDVRRVRLDFTGPYPHCELEVYTDIDGGGYTLADKTPCYTEEVNVGINLPSTATTLSLKIVATGPSALTVNKLTVGGIAYPIWYEAFNGTSMAAPFITGALVAGKVLYKEIVGSDINNAALLGIMYKTAKIDSKLVGKSNGRIIDMGAFLSSIEQCAQIPSTCVVSPSETVFPTREESSGGVNPIDPSPINPSPTGPVVSEPSVKSSGCALNFGGTSTTIDIMLLSIPFLLVGRILVNRPRVIRK